MTAPRGTILVSREGAAVHLEVRADGMHLATLAYSPAAALNLADRLFSAAADPQMGRQADAARAVERARSGGGTP
ncbi:MAG: hypothetical protein GC150_17260 [Rhizobiales bacterium]|nr:hypothetical protein [Hyphomicrobiales bacterium]